MPGALPSTLVALAPVIRAAVQADPLGLLVAFGAGMLSFFSPCVLPMVPAYLSMVSGLSSAELKALQDVPEPSGDPVPGESRTAVDSVPTDRGASGGTVGLAATKVDVAPVEAADRQRFRRRLVRGIASFVGGFTVVFVLLGAAASELGSLLDHHKPLLIDVSGVLVIVFGAMLILMALGVRMPLVVVADRRIDVRPSALGLWAPPIMGMAFAFAWTPCVGPVLGSVLSLAAARGGSSLGGVALLLAYSLGLGVPFLLAGVAFGRMTDVLARIRGSLRIIDLVGGAIMVIFGILVLTGQVGILAAHIGGWLNDLHLGRLSTS
jgi:cytochrome c-type biogenesis protein